MLERQPDMPILEPLAKLLQGSTGSEGKFDT